MAKRGHGNPYRRRRMAFLVVLSVCLAAWAAYETYQTKQYNVLIQRADTLGVQIAAGAENFELAREALGRLAVRESMSREGYSRDLFSSDWATVGGCDMRNHILKRDMLEAVVDPSDNCTVLSGSLSPDPYTGNTVSFTRGPGTSNTVQIDHVVPVSDAWRKGAQQLTSEQRQAFYNDPLNLLAVDGPANMEKGDKDASNWLPRVEYRCRYVARQIAVKIRYMLWVTTQELQAMSRVLSTCPTQVLPIEFAGSQ